MTLEHVADYAQSPYAGIRYFENVQRTLGKEKTAEFARLYTAPGVDHVGSGAPANVDMLSVLVDWVEKARQAPGDLEVTEQKVEAPAFETVRALPLCQWPAWPHYQEGQTIRPEVSTARREFSSWLGLSQPSTSFPPLTYKNVGMPGTSSAQTRFALLPRHDGSYAVTAHFTSEHPPSAIGRNACSAGIVEISL